jgi:hypothetical protein
MADVALKGEMAFVSLVVVVHCILILFSNSAEAADELSFIIFLVGV